MISTHEENGVMVFEKPRSNDLEAKFYNPDYFRLIGFPDADIRIVSLGQVGGYYDHPEELSWPYRQFVYAVQSTTLPPEESDHSDLPVVESSVEKDKPDVGLQRFDPKANLAIAKTDLGQFSVMYQRFSQGLSGFTEKVNSYFNTQSQTPVDNQLSISNSEEKDQPPSPPLVDNQLGISNEKDEQIQEEKDQPPPPVDNQLSISNEKEQIQEEKDQPPPPVDNNQTKWVIRIPIIQDESLIPLSTYEKQDLVLKQKLREHKAEQMAGIVVDGQRYDIGNRSIYMGQISQGKSVLKVDTNGLEGTLVWKYAQLLTRQ